MATVILDLKPLGQRLNALKSTSIDETCVDCTRQNADEIRKRYRDLELPCYEFVAALRDVDRLNLLADHAQLDPAPSLRPFPFRIPRPPKDHEFVKVWSPGEAQNTDDATACSRLLLWFAVAHNPIEFGADVLYWQQLQMALPLYRPEGRQKVRPIMRIPYGIFNAAHSLLNAANDYTDAGLLDDVDQPQNENGDDISDPVKYPTLKKISDDLAVNSATLYRWRQEGILVVRREGKGYVCSKSELKRLRKPR